LRVWRGCESGPTVPVRAMASKEIDGFPFLGIPGMIYTDNGPIARSHVFQEDWIANLPPDGIREICAWERFCTFARKPQRRKVGGDARISVNGIAYEVDPDLAGQKVILWWGIFDSELYLESGDERFGPYRPVGGPIPLNRYRAFKKTAAEKRADKVESLAGNLRLPIEALSKDSRVPEALKRSLPEDTKFNAFVDPDPFQEINYPSILAAKKAISNYLGLPLGKLEPDQIATIDEILSKTLTKSKVIKKIRTHLKPGIKER
jgi:hypothetical protein